MDAQEIPDEAIRKVKIRNYQFDDRNKEDNVKVTIFLNQDHELAEEVDCNCIEMKAGIMNAAELDNVRQKIADQ